MAQPSGQRRVIQRLQLRPREGFRAPGQPHLARDGAGRGGVVARHHDDAHARAAAFGQRRRHFGARRVGQRHQAQKIKVEIVLARRPQRRLVAPWRSTFPAPARHAQHAQATLGHGFHLAADGAAPLGVQVAQIGHRFGRTLGGQQVHIRLTAGEHPGHGQDVAREGVLKLRLAPRVHMLGAGQPLAAEMLDGFLHWVERIARCGQHGKFNQPVKIFGQLAGALCAEMRAVRRQLGHGHAIDGEGAGLVHRQHGDGTQRLHSSDTPCQHLLVRNTPSTQRQEHGQDHRNLFRQDGHSQGNARQQAVEQRVVVPPPAQQHLGRCKHHRRQPQGAYQLA